MTSTTSPPGSRPRGGSPGGPPVGAGGLPTGRAAGPRLGWRVRLRRDRTLLVMTLPALALLVAFTYLPMFGTITAFQRYNYITGFRNSPLVGLENFRALFADPMFWRSLENTLVLSLVQIALYFPLPIALAILLSTLLSDRVRSFVQAVTYLPHFFGWVVVVTLFQQMLGGAGLLNHFLRSQDLGTWDVMTNPETFKYLVTAQVVWKESGWGIIVFLAAIAAIDPSLYESAAVDGAGRWRRMWHITLPGMRSVIVLMLVLRLGNSLTIGFEQFLIQRFAVGSDAAEVLDTYAYYYGVLANNYGLGAAAGLFKGVVSLVLVLAANKLAHAFGEDGLYRGSR